MMSKKTSHSIKRALWTGTIITLGASLHSMANAADSSATKDESDESLQEVVVTGSLIPQRRQETSTPVMVISSDDMQLKGFTSVADALQRTSMATGAVQGPQNNGGFTQGAQTLSLFGLSPSYTKFLIDGRPIADYPALYNGTDIITSIDGIPEVMIDHVDILPGGQSSIYGSDAIAGVVNILLKKKMDEPEIDLRYGWTKDGGGTEKRIGLADGFTVGNLNIVAGAQYQKTDPIWGYQRPLTNQYYPDGASPQTAERDWLVFGLNGQANGDTYYFQDPATCANVSNQFDNSVGLRTRGNFGQYCGTFRAGYYTINNGTEAEQGYVHAGYDIGDHTQIFADVLLDHDVTLFNTGTSFFSSADDSSGPYNYFADLQVTPCTDLQNGSDCDLLNVQRIFSPEEAGNLREQNDKDTKNSVRTTLGIKGQIGASSWQYTADMTYTENKLAEATHLAFTQAINDFFAPIFGPNLGPDPFYGQPTYDVNFAQLYRPITPAGYASFTGYATSYSRTEEALARVQLTNSSLFKLPGGSAGIAVVLEGGDQGWDYTPDPRFLDGETYLFTATAGSGHRSRWSGTAELRLPLTSMFTMDISDRYDNYHVDGDNVSRNTYNLGLEFRPISSLLLRGRYGTSFKAPTLSDEFQGTSGFYQQITDYYTCSNSGYTGSTLSNCPQADEYVFGTTAGNPQLKPITAKNWDMGVAWTPWERLSLTADFIHWQITNEVSQLDSDQLMRTNSACLLGQLDANSPTCVEAISLVTRDSNGLVTQISTPKANVANETLSVGVLGVDYAWVTNNKGEFDFEGSYSDLLKHSFQRFAGDPEINLLSNPFYSTDFKTKANLSVTWKVSEFAWTLYVEHYGKTPNYAAQQTVDGYASPGADDVGTWTITNLSGKYTVIPGLELLANINNVFNTMPPVDHSQPGTASQPFNIFNYSNYGRSYFIGMKYEFGH